MKASDEKDENSLLNCLKTVWKMKHYEQKALISHSFQRACTTELLKSISSWMYYSGYEGKCLNCLWNHTF